MAITTMSKVKTILGINDNSKDAIICDLIPLIEEAYLVMRNKDFDVDEDTEETIYPTGAELVAIEMINYHLNTMKSAGVVSESLGDHSITYMKN